MISLGSFRFLDWTYWTPNPIQLFWGLIISWAFKKYLLPKIDTFGRERFVYGTLIYTLVPTGMLSAALGGVPLMSFGFDLLTSYPHNITTLQLIGFSVFTVAGFLSMIASIKLQIKAEKKNLKILFPMV